MDSFVKDSAPRTEIDEEKKYWFSLWVAKRTMSILPSSLNAQYENNDTTIVCSSFNSSIVEWSEYKRCFCCTRHTLLYGCSSWMRFFCLVRSTCCELISGCTKEDSWRSFIGFLDLLWRQCVCRFLRRLKSDDQNEPRYNEFCTRSFKTWLWCYVWEACKETTTFALMSCQSSHLFYSYGD